MDYQVAIREHLSTQPKYLSTSILKVTEYDVGQLRFIGGVKIDVYVRTKLSSDSPCRIYCNNIFCLFYYNRLKKTYESDGEHDGGLVRVGTVTGVVEDQRDAILDDGRRGKLILSVIE